MLNKCKIQAVVFKNVMQIPEFSVKSDKKPEKYAQKQKSFIYFFLFALESSPFE